MLASILTVVKPTATFKIPLRGKPAQHGGRAAKKTKILNITGIFAV
jgi:hypothetical protein